MIVKLVMGIGINDFDGPVKVKGRHLQFYLCWRSMICRCTETFWRTSPTYVGTTVCDEWRSLSNFKLWFDVNYVAGWQLDKDILGGIKHYSPSTCVFAPGAINALFIDSGAARGNLPVGICRHADGGLEVQIRNWSESNKRQRVTKHFTADKLDEAVAWYRKEKLAECYKRCKHFKDHPGIDPRLIPAVIAKARELYED